MHNFAIMRHKKLKSFGSVAASLQHCYRERNTPNAAEHLTPNNVHFCARDSDQAVANLKKLLPEKRRKDAVLCVEYMMSASPEFWKNASKEQQEQFFSNAMNWLCEKYGSKNIVTASIHLDETSPHLSVFVAPITSEGRLSAKEFIGSRKILSEDQTSFAKAVGLDRGVEKSKAKHQTIQQFYSKLEEQTALTEQNLREQQALSEKIRTDAQTEQKDRHCWVNRYLLQPKLIEKKFFGKDIYESLDDVADRINEKIHEHYQPAVAKVADYERLAKDSQKQITKLEKEVKELTKTLESETKRLTSDSQTYRWILDRLDGDTPRTNHFLRSMLKLGQGLIEERTQEYEKQVEEWKKRQQENINKGGRKL